MVVVGCYCCYCWLLLIDKRGSPPKSCIWVNFEVIPRLHKRKQTKAWQWPLPCQPGWATYRGERLPVLGGWSLLQGLQEPWGEGSSSTGLVGFILRQFRGHKLDQQLSTDNLPSGQTVLGNKLEVSGLENCLENSQHVPRLCCLVSKKLDWEWLGI